MNKSIETAVVPVAGLGTRLLPITLAVAKELLPLGQKPTLQYIVEELGRSGIRRVVFVTSESKRNIDQLFRRNEYLENRLAETSKNEILAKLWSQSEYRDMEFEIAIQTEQLGLGHAVLCGESIAGDQPIVVALGDCVIGMNGASNILQRMIQVFHEESADIVVAFQQVPDELVSRFGIAKPVGTYAADNLPAVFELADLVEKPALDTAPSRLAVTARYVFSPKIFASLQQTGRGHGNEIQLTDAIRSLIGNGGKAFGVQLNPGEHRYDVGNINSYTEAFVRFALDDPSLRENVMNAMEREID